LSSYFFFFFCRTNNSDPRGQNVLIPLELNPLTFHCFYRFTRGPNPIKR